MPGSKHNSIFQCFYHYLIARRGLGPLTSNSASKNTPGDLSRPPDLEKKKSKMFFLKIIKKYFGHKLSSESERERLVTPIL